MTNQLTNQLIYDAWTALSFKQPLGARQVPGHSWAAPSWIGKDNERRLMAYRVLQAYLDNAAREFLNTDDQDLIKEHREYGDAALIRDAALSALLGEEQTIVVDGAVEEGQIPAAAEDEGETEEAAEAAAARAQQEWLEQWAEDERLLVKMQEVERDAVGLGDGVYVLGWSSTKKRPRLRMFDPGFYFPVLHDGNEDDYPQRVHIAWELEDPKDPSKKSIRRLTWELVPLVDEDGAPTEVTVPYQSEPVRQTCLFTDATWRLDRARASTVDELSAENAIYNTNEEGEEARDLDLGIDFIPVIHIPNTVAVKDHYGQSVLSKVAQILDDLSNADTDLAAASSTTGAPPIALSGTGPQGEQLVYQPGTVFRTGEGRMDVLDTSRSLDALLGYIGALLDRLSINGRLPAAILGRVKPSEVPSGIALALSFGPLSSLIREMRLTRTEKYRLMFKFAHRLALVGGENIDGLPIVHRKTDLEFGAYLPSDQSAAVDLVTSLMTAGVISLEQAVMILKAAGITDRDQQSEISSIQGRDFAGANELLDATGDPQAVLDYLGIEGEPVVRPQPSGGTTLPDLDEPAAE